MERAAIFADLNKNHHMAIEGIKFNKPLLINKLCLPNRSQYISRVDVCETMLSNYQDKLKCIITVDETWIYAYEPETTEQSSEYRAKGVARSKRACQSRSKIKVMITVFFDFRGVHYELLPLRQTVNKEYYLSVMRRLREAIRLKRSELWANNSWFL